MELAVKEGREARPGLPCGVCGEHGGDAGSIRFFHKMGLDYVSCAPCRIPIARLSGRPGRRENPGGNSLKGTVISYWLPVISDQLSVTVISDQ
jgi:hypothetical protein